MELAKTFSNTTDFFESIEYNFNDLTMALDEDDTITATYEDFDDVFEIKINGECVCTTNYIEDALDKWNETVNFYEEQFHD